MHKLFYKAISCILITLHLVTFGPVRDAFAFSAASASYKLNSGTLDEGGKNRQKAYTKLLLHGDGSDASKSFKDEIGYTVTANGDAQIDTAQSKFGGSSCLFDGSGDYLTLADSDDWNFGSQDFTVDFWVKFNALPAAGTSYGLFDQYLNNNNRTNLQLFHRASPDRYELYWISTDRYDVTGYYSQINPAWSPAVNTWYHIAIVRYGNVWTLYVNGQSLLSQTKSYAIPDLAAAFQIGILTSGSFLNGWIDEFRVSKGIARWTSNFTPPTTPYVNSPESTNAAQLWQDAIGEPCIGKSSSTNFILNSGLIPIIQSNPPVLLQDIPYQSWAMNIAKNNAFDLDNYFSSSEAYALNFSVSGNSNINVAIDPVTHLVSFSQPTNWYGAEKIYFYATDSENNIMQSNMVSLQVANTSANKPVIVDVSLSPSIIKEGDLAKITIKARDLDNDTLTFTYNSFFAETRKWKEGDFWFSEATWQTNSSSTGHYNIRVTVTDPGSLTDTESIQVNVGNLNRPPVLTPLSDITASEGALVVITPHATDPDNDPIIYYYTSLFDSQGKWLTDYDDAGTRTVTVIASDGIDTVSQNVKVIINNTNRAPQTTLTLDKYTVKPDDQITISLSALDPDSDSMTFSIKKDGVQIASGAITTTYTTTTSFSVMGGHTISATVTDSAGLSSTDTKGVDVADPNANREYINPVMGDFNADALADLGLHNAQTGTWEICVSDAGVFRNAVQWLTGFGTSLDWWPIGGDFNGDGKTDAGVYNNTTGELKIALSIGSSFSSPNTWLNVPNASYSWQPFTGNFNGDKYTDFGLYNKDTGEIRIALGNGSGFGAFTIWLAGFGTNYLAMAGDFNGDSLTDLCLFKKSTGEFKVSFSNTKAFVDGTTWISGFAVDKDSMITDYNNDGLADVGYWDKSNYNWYYAISTGTKFVDKGMWLASFGTTNDESASTGDFNGDGITDAATFDRDQIGINRWKTQLSVNKPADLLTEIDNGIGGKTQISYSYAAQADNSALPFPVFVASSISSINSISATATYTQNFSFYGGWFDATDREFRGFAKVKVVDPITNNFSETYFYQGKDSQDGALKGQIDKIIAYDGNSRLISQSLNTYEVRKAGPEQRVLGFPMLKQQDTTVWEENGNYITTSNSFTYDNIGNLLEERNEGDVSKTGDEKSAATTYAQAYEAGFNRLLETVLKDKDGNVVSKKDFEYDAKGNLAADILFISNPLTQTQESARTEYSYDSYGNLVSTINALGSAVTTEYESTFNAYPQRVTNSLSHTITYIYEPKFGAVKSVTDANGYASSTSYDSFGRVVQVTNADNQVTTTYSYPDFNTKVTTQLNFVKTEYIDGLGRKYKTVSTGEDGVSDRQVSSEVYYNNRGLVDRETIAHYIDEDPAQISYVRYEYDIRARVKKTISDFPGTLKDAEATVSYIEPLYTETTDPQGHRKGSRKDIYGNVIEVTEFTQGGVYKTAYEYDLQGNLVKVTDSKGNANQIWYDSIGKKLKMNDPDMGIWTYDYDILGNLKKQTDAKGQVLEFTYDVLNRLTNKSANGQTIVTYLYDDASKQNCIGRLSKVTDQSGSTEFFYDKFGREIKSTKTISGVAYTVERTYDILDRLTSLKYPDAETVNYSYDANSGSLEKVIGNRAYVQDVSYNAKGQIRNMRYGNGVQTSYTYGQDLRLSRILTQGATSLQDLNYNFDKNGNVVTLTDNLRSNIRTFTYDELDRLTRAENVPAPSGGYTNFDYQYDAIGNMIYKSDIGVMSYGAIAGPHALTSAGGYTYQYDANGNMVTGKNKQMEYDAENRLSRVNELGIVTTFAYDGDGGRVKKTRLDTNAYTIYIGSLYEVDSSGVTTKYIFAGSNRVCSLKSDGTSYYYHGDHLGSSNIISDASGNLVQHCEYTPYGTLARNEGSDVVKQKFTGKELDNTGLYFYGARYYDPEIGRFITADTIVQEPYNPQTLNRYSYCGNNPINYVDPSGHFFWFAVIIGAILGGVSAAQNDQPIWKGVLMGAVGGALTAGGASLGFWGAVAGGMLSGAGNSAVMGGNIGYGALAGGIGAGLGYGLGNWAAGLKSNQFLAGLGGAMLAGSISGGLGAELAGGKFGSGAWMGAAYAAGGYLGSYGLQRTIMANRYNKSLQRISASLSPNESATNYRIGYRPVKLFGIKVASHMFIQEISTGRIIEMGPGQGGRATIYDYNPNDPDSLMTAMGLNGGPGGGTPANTTNALSNGDVSWGASFSGSPAALGQVIQSYSETWGSVHYNAASNNSNYFAGTAASTIAYGGASNVGHTALWAPTGLN